VPAAPPIAGAARRSGGDELVSVEAISWALNLAPVPRDRGGKRNPACKAVLVGLANHAATDGKEETSNLLQHGADSGVRQLHPEAGFVDKATSGVQPLHPAAATGCHGSGNELQPPRRNFQRTPPPLGGYVDDERFDQTAGELKA
jgi:hypothetical protein